MLKRTSRLLHGHEYKYHFINRTSCRRLYRFVKPNIPFSFNINWKCWNANIVKCTIKSSYSAFPSQLADRKTSRKLSNISKYDIAASLISIIKIAQHAIVYLAILAKISFTFNNLRYHQKYCLRVHKWTNTCIRLLFKSPKQWQQSNTKTKYSWTLHCEQLFR